MTDVPKTPTATPNDVLRAALDEAHRALDRGDRGKAIRVLDVARGLASGAPGTASAATPADALTKLRSRLMAITDNVLDVAPPPREWLISDVLVLGKVGILAAAGGVGKSSVLVNLAVAVATGNPWFGLATSNPGRVLLALGEEDESEVRRRIYYTARDKNLSEESRANVMRRIVALPLAGMNVGLVEGEGGEIRESAMLEAFRQLLNDGGERWSLIVLDPLSRFAGADTEKDNAAATRFVEAVESLAMATGATVLMAHHTTKEARKEGETPGTGIRGATGLHDAIRWAGTLDGDAGGIVGLVQFAVRKSNYTAKGEPVYLVMGKEGVLRRIDKDEHARMIAERDAKKAAEKAKKEKRNGSSAKRDDDDSGGFTRDDF